MDTGILKTAGQVAGIGGLALGVFLLLFREVIRKSIFPNLNKEQGYRLLMLILILVWTIALAGIVAWVYVKTLENKQNTQKDGSLSGVVVDKDGRGIPDVLVSIVGRSLQDQTTTSGSFFFKLQTGEGNTVRLQAYKEGYISWNEIVVVPNSNLRIPLLTLEQKSLPADTKDGNTRTGTSDTRNDNGLKNMKKSGRNNNAVEKPPVITDQTVNRPS